MRAATVDRADPATARAVVAAAVRGLAPSTVGLGEAGIGCVLAGPLWARNPLPAFDSAAMDGYAVRGPGPWRVLGITLAGDPAARALPEGGAVGVSTGAALPPGCDGVLRAEDAVRSGDELLGPAPAGRDIRHRGEECAPWTPVLPPRTPVTPGVLALAAALGWDELTVRRRPRVAVVLTGGEVRTAGDPGDGRIRDALGPLLVPTLRAAGADPTDPTRPGDDAKALEAVLAAAADGPGRADLVVTTAGTAAGPTDRVREVLRRLDVQPVLDGLASRPGRPTMLGLLPGGVPVLSLPGNPLAALAGLVLVGVPVLAALQDRALPESRPARLATAVAAHPRDTRVEPVRRLGGAALPLGRPGSGGVRAAALADGLGLVPPGVDLTAGDEVDVLDIPGAARAG